MNPRTEWSAFACERMGCRDPIAAVVRAADNSIQNVCAGCLRLLFVKREIRALFHLHDPNWLAKHRRLPGPGLARARARA